MPTVTLENIKGRDVADRLIEELGLEADRTYTLVVHSEDAEMAGARSLEEVVDIVGKRARKRGLTKKLLEKILDDR